jgi:hypothetical protein
MRAKHQQNVVGHIYTCQPRSRGGCAGIGRSGPKVDEYVTEAVLAKLEERRLAAVPNEPWDRAEQLERLVKQREALSVQWNDGGVSDEFFFPALAA